MTGKNVALILRTLFEDRFKVAKVELQMPSYVLVTTKNDKAKALLKGSAQIKELERITGVTISVQ